METTSQQKDNDSTNPRRVIVKAMIVSRSTDVVLGFFKNVLCPKIKRIYLSLEMILLNIQQNYKET
jgi:hypothetical protein